MMIANVMLKMKMAYSHFPPLDIVLILTSKQSKKLFHRKPKVQKIVINNYWYYGNVIMLLL